LECVVWHPVPQHAGVAHSQPSVSGAVPALQSRRPELQLYEQVVPSQLGCPVFVLQIFPHAPQLAVDVFDASQPSKSPLSLTQSSHPLWQPP
jgi:hypothetical protein